MSKTKVMKGLDGIKSELTTRINYTSNFDFETFEINDDDVKYITEREKTLLDNGKKYIESLYDICKSLYEVSEKLKDHKQGTFMSWYTNIGLNKDNVSELLKRWSLYEERDDLKPYISGLSGLAVRILTNKSVTKEMRDLVYEGNYTSSNDIKQIINKIDNNKETMKVEKTVIPFYKNVFSFEKHLEKLEPEEVKEAIVEIENIEKEVLKIKEILKGKSNFIIEGS